MRKELMPKKEFTKVADSKGIQKIYLLRIAKIMVLTAILIAANVWISIFNLRFLSDYQQKQDKLFFANRIEARVSLAVATYRELLSTNNLAQVENVPPLEELIKLIGEIVTIKNTAFDYLLGFDSQIDSEVQNVLLGDPCSLLGTPLYIQLCESSESLGKKPGLIYLLNSLENSLQEKIADYTASDKSKASLKSILEKDFGAISLMYIVINAESELISKIIDQSFEQSFYNTKGQRIFALSLLYVTLALVAVFAWPLVFAEMRKSVVRFKNILRVFPPDVILASFVLKLFLMKTSKGILDTIRNDI